MGLTHLIKQQTTLSELTNHFDTTGFQPEENETIFEEETLYHVTYGDSTKTPLAFDSWLSRRLERLEGIDGSAISLFKLFYNCNRSNSVPPNYNQRLLFINRAK